MASGRITGLICFSIVAWPANGIVSTTNSAAPPAAQIPAPGSCTGPRYLLLVTKSFLPAERRRKHSPQHAGKVAKAADLVLPRIPAHYCSRPPTEFATEHESSNARRESGRGAQYPGEKAM